MAGFQPPASLHLPGRRGIGAAAGAQATALTALAPPLGDGDSREGQDLTMADAGQLGGNAFILKKREEKGFKDPKVFLADMSVINFFTRQNGQKMNAIKG